MVSVHMCGFSGGAAADIADPFCSLEIQNNLLYAWHTQKQQSYIELLNESLGFNPIRVSVATARVEGRLRRRASEVANKCNKLSKRKKQQYKVAKTYLTLGREEVVQPSTQLQEEFEQLSESVEEVR